MGLVQVVRRTRAIRIISAVRARLAPSGLSAPLNPVTPVAFSGRATSKR